MLLVQVHDFSVMSGHFPGCIESGLRFQLADPGPLMLGVLDRWTPTVNLLLTLIAQISFHIELYPIAAIYSISLYTTPLSIWLSGFRDFFQFILF